MSGRLAPPVSDTSYRARGTARRRREVSTSSERGRAFQLAVAQVALYATGPSSWSRGARRGGVPPAPALPGTAVERTKRTTARRRSLRTRAAVGVRTCADRGGSSIELVPDCRDVTRRRIPAPAGRCQSFPGSERRSERAAWIPQRGWRLRRERSRRPADPSPAGPFQDERGSAQGNHSGTLGGCRKRRPAGRAFQSGSHACSGTRSCLVRGDEHARRVWGPGSSRSLLDTEGSAALRIRWARATSRMRGRLEARARPWRSAGARVWSASPPGNRGALLPLSSPAAATEPPAPVDAARPTSRGGPGTAPRSPRTSRRPPAPTPARR